MALWGARWHLAAVARIYGRAFPTASELEEGVAEADVLPDIRNREPVDQPIALEYLALHEVHPMRLDPILLPDSTRPAQIDHRQRWLFRVRRQPAIGFRLGGAETER